MEELMNTHPNFYEWRHLEQCQEPLTAWSPRVDPESPIPFMPKEPIDVMKEGAYTHVPWITGITDDEGAFKASALMHDLKTLAEIEAEFERLGPMVFGFHDGQCEAPKIHAMRVSLVSSPKSLFEVDFIVGFGWPNIFGDKIQMYLYLLIKASHLILLFSDQRLLLGKCRQQTKDHRFE